MFVFLLQDLFGSGRRGGESCARGKSALFISPLLHVKRLQLRYFKKFICNVM